MPIHRAWEVLRLRQPPLRGRTSTVQVDCRRSGRIQDV